MTDGEAGGLSVSVPLSVSRNTKLISCVIIDMHESCNMIAGILDVQDPIGSLLK